MAQHPAKIQWREEVPHGLSASQFGMALGLCGRVVDFVDYLRSIVGTELEFKGNACTNHGIATEPKARALYELLTGSVVSDGGFFHTEDRVLGCSPDGRIFLDPTTTPLSSSPTTPSNVVSVRIPFKSKRQRLDKTTVFTSPRNSVGERCRLLEIKSPFRSLYDGSKPAYQPFGIPQHYLCQLQGQMAIADCEECDFFVYLDNPSCQVVAWRVRRSVEFWEWANPKLRQVSAWVHDGPPSWLDRSYQFEPFDFSRIVVEPLIFPYDITANSPIRDPKRFPFFEAHVNPYDKPVSTQYNTEAVTTTTKVEGTHDRVASLLLVLSSPVTRFLFHSDEEDEDILNCVVPSTSAALVTFCGLSWNSLMPHQESLVGPLVVGLHKPRGFENDFVVCCVGGGVFRVNFWQQMLLTSLTPSSQPNMPRISNPIDSLTNIPVSAKG